VLKHYFASDKFKSNIRSFHHNIILILIV